jgi:hypothetical protein
LVSCGVRADAKGLAGIKKATIALKNNPPGLPKKRGFHSFVFLDKQNKARHATLPLAQRR